MKIVYKQFRLLFLVMCAFLSFNTSTVFAEDNVITVYYGRDIGIINKKIFGSSFMGLDPIMEVWPMYYYNRADYGTGVWNPNRNDSVKEVIKLARDAGLSIMRFYTGNHFNWKNAIGKKRKHYLYGIDEYMKTMEKIGAEPLFVASYFSGDEQDAADLVEYLNAPCDGKHPWADERAKNGHPVPYGVKYFEFGNEVFVATERNNKKIQVRPEEYADKYLVYQKAMKSIDPSVQLGLVLHHYDWRWDRKVLEKVGQNVDFVVRHIYPPKDLAYYGSANNHKTEELFEIILGSIVFYTEKQFGITQKIVSEITGKDDVYHAITEYNIGIEEQKPPYRFSLGSALVNAELIRIFMKPENKVLMANHWNFIEGSWGMIKLKEDYTKHETLDPEIYVKRPNYYVYELYNKHFGDILLDTDIKVETYDIGQNKPYMRAYINNSSNRILIEYEWLNNKWLDRVKRTVMRGLHTVKGDDEILEENLLTGEWKIKNVPGVVTEINEGILSIYFKEPEEYNYYHSVKHASVEPNTYYKLSGYIKTENLIDKIGVSLAVVDGRGWTKTHSAEGTNKIAGNVEWQYVEVVYKTLPDAKSVEVQAYRIGKEGPLKGRAFFKDVKLQKYIPPDTVMPYLTVNASKNKKGDKLYLMVVNKNMSKEITTLMDIKDFALLDMPPHSGTGSRSGLLQVNAWILNGPSVDSTNEEKAENVKIIHKEIDVDKVPFKFTFEPHSLTAIEIGKK